MDARPDARPDGRVVLTDNAVLTDNTVTDTKLKIRASRSADAFYSLVKKAHRPPFAPLVAERVEEQSQVPLTSSRTLRAHFFARKATAWGDQLRLVGSSAQLGNWNPALTSVTLSTDKLSYPLWAATVELELPSDDAALLEYKIVVVRAEKRNVAPLVEWEPLTENRRVAPHARHSAKAAHVALSWGEPGASIRWRWEW